MPTVYDKSEAFWAKVAVADIGCWYWQGAVSGSYGNFRGETTAHRFAYEDRVGPIPEDLHIDHLCGNRLCVRPDHLEAVTQAENNRRAARPHSSCHRGHPFTSENVYVNSQGNRMCRTCSSARNRRYYRRKQERDNADSL